MSAPALPAPSVATSTHDRRTQILSAALICLEATGLRGTRVEDVLREAGVSRATFYRHFANIDAIVIELAVRAGRDALFAAIADSKDARADAVRRIARAIAAMAVRQSDSPILEMLAQSGQLMRISNLIMASQHAITILSEPLLPLLEAGRADGSLRLDISSDHMVEWLTRNATSIRFRLPPWAHGIDELEAYVIQFVMPALLAPQPAGLEPLLTRLDAIEHRLDRAVGIRNTPL